MVGFLIFNFCFLFLDVPEVTVDLVALEVIPEDSLREILLVLNQMAPTVVMVHKLWPTLRTVRP